MNDHIEVLRGLVAKWRSAADSWRPLISGGSQAEAIASCADELDAALAALSAQGEAQAGGEAVERVAAEICRHDSTSPFWADLPEQFKPRYRDMARAAIAAVATTPPPSAVPADLLRPDSISAMRDWLGTQELRIGIGNVTGCGEEYLESTAGMLLRLVDSLAAAPGPKEGA